ncbi:MAG: hypothetical protein WC156_15130 [Pedobacter sp.]
MKNDSDQKTNVVIKYSVAESAMLATKSGCFVICAAFFMTFAGIAMSGYKEIPMSYRVIMSLLFGPYLLILPNDPELIKKYQLLGLIISAFIWGAIVFVAHRIYCKYKSKQKGLPLQ